jgi:hypothetical protein
MAVVIGRWPTRRVVQDPGGYRIHFGFVFGKQRVQFLAGDRTAQPREARHEHKLKLRDDGASQPQEKVVEAAVLEVILDACAADPANSAVDNDDLAMIDVPELVEVPPCGRSRHNRLRWRTYLSCANHSHGDTSGYQPVKEGTTRPVGVGALPIDYEPYGDAFARLRKQRLGEAFPDDAGPESELVDVDGRERGLDVSKHRRVEVPTLNVHLGGRG